MSHRQYRFQDMDREVWTWDDVLALRGNPRKTESADGTRDGASRTWEWSPALSARRYKERGRKRAGAVPVAITLI